MSVLSGFDSRRADDTSVWLNLEERSVPGREVAGSIPATQTVEEESVGEGASPLSRFIPAHYPFDESRGVSPAMGFGFCAQCAADPGDGFDGVAFLRADTHRGWGIASMAEAAARWARFS